MGISFNEVKHEYLGIKKIDNVDALNGINLDIDSKGEFVAIVGKTGSGKSTLLQHINGLLLPTSGTVIVNDNVITPNKKKNPKMFNIRKEVGFVFQFPEYQLFEETVLKDIMFAPLNFGLSKEEAKLNALKAAKLLEIDESLLNKSPFNLSGGQMRKVAIAGILAYNPNVLLLDEPTRGLDPKTAVEVMNLFKKVHEETKKTIILITHDMNIVLKYATRVIGLDSGKIVYDGSVKELFETDSYLKCHLIKPDIYKMIDYLNTKLNLNLDYNITDLSSLEEKLKEVSYE